MTNKTYQLETLTCPSCVAKIDGAMKSTKGIGKAEVLFNSSKVKVEFDESVITPLEIKTKIQKLGYQVLSEK